MGQKIQETAAKITADLKSSEPQIRISAIQKAGELEYMNDHVLRTLNEVSLMDSSREVRNAAREAHSRLASKPHLLEESPKSQSLLGNTLQIGATLALIGIVALLVWAGYEMLSWNLRLSQEVIQPLRSGTISKAEAESRLDSIVAGSASSARSVIDTMIEESIPGSESVIVYVLDNYGDADAAVTLLNSGNWWLEGAARNWAARHGYTITTTVGDVKKTWRNQ